MKKITLFLPLLLTLGIIFYHMAFDSKEQVQLVPAAKSNNRELASDDLQQNIFVSFQKVNNAKAIEDGGRAQAEGDDRSKQQLANEDINYLKLQFFGSLQSLNSPDFQKKSTAILEKVRRNPEGYDQALGILIQEALLGNDHKEASEVFSIAASLPLGRSAVNKLAQEILLDMSTTDREWDEELFRNSMQFYYVQSFIREEESDPLIEQLLEKCPNEELCKKIKIIDKELNIYARQSEDQNEFHQ